MTTLSNITDINAPPPPNSNTPSSILAWGKGDGWVIRGNTAGNTNPLYDFNCNAINSLAIQGKTGGLFSGKTIQLWDHVAINGHLCLGGTIMFNNSDSDSRIIYKGPDWPFMTFNGKSYITTDGLMIFGTNRNQTPGGLRNIFMSDNLFISNDTIIGGNLYVLKKVTISETISVSSDYRLKSNVRDIEEITTLNLRPVQYEMQENHRIGLIAHEVQEQIPYVVTGEKDGKEMQSVNYIDLIPVLIKDIQRLSKKNADLEERILRLESLLLDNSRTR